MAILILKLSVLESAVQLDKNLLCYLPYLQIVLGCTQGQKWLRQRDLWAW